MSLCIFCFRGDTSRHANRSQHSNALSELSIDNDSVDISLGAVKHNRRQWIPARGD